MLLSRKSIKLARDAQQERNLRLPKIGKCMTAALLGFFVED
jgi:hypothetical protein